VGETYRVGYNPDHRWFYFPRMRRDEALVFKVYESAKDGRARFTAHQLFDDRPRLRARRRARASRPERLRSSTAGLSSRPRVVADHGVDTRVGLEASARGRRR